MTISDLTRENYERQLLKILEDTMPKLGPNGHNSGPAGPLGRPPDLPRSPLTLHHLVLLPMIYTIDFWTVLGQFIQQ